MAKSYLRQIIMEELQKVLKEEVRLRDPKVVELQKLLSSAGYNVGAIDGIPGKKLFQAISQASGKFSGVKISPEQVARDFTSEEGMAAENFLTAFQDIKSAVSSPTASSPTKKTSSKVSASTEPSNSSSSSIGKSRNVAPKEGDKMTGELGTKVYHNGEWIPESEYQQLQKGLEEATSRELRRLMRKI